MFNTTSSNNKTHHVDGTTSSNINTASSKILVTGGTGYIGSHVLVELLEQGYTVVVLDNLSNSSRASLERVTTITGKRATLYQADVRDEEALRRMFVKEGSFQAVVHLAGLKAVGESTRLPLAYYDHNVGGTLTLLTVMQSFECFRLIFSSSATVYGSAAVPFSEDGTCTGIGISSPYGNTKFLVEQMLRDLPAPWKCTILRYFNPIGAHVSGLIGEDPRGLPNNLMPFVAQVCVGRIAALTIHGNDYDTPDGTCVRDYIHVVDLAQGHVAAVTKLLTGSHSGCEIFNLGCGVGYSVLQVVQGMEAATHASIPVLVGPRRAGDRAECFALVDKAQRELGWKSQKSLRDMCVDTWRWQASNPQGYDDSSNTT